MIMKQLIKKKEKKLKKKTIYNYYLDKHKDFMKNTEISYRKTHGCILGKEGISIEQVTEIRFLLSRMMPIVILF